MINKLFYYLNKNRNDITWIKGDSPENCNWDKTLPNQQEIIDLLQKYNESQVVIVPFSVKPRQLKTAIVLSGITLEDVDLAINSIQEPDRTIAKIAWEYSIEFERNHQMVESVATILNLTSEQVDEIYILAETL
jgi:hypothetical protein